MQECCMLTEPLHWLYHARTMRRVRVSVKIIHKLLKLRMPGTTLLALLVIARLSKIASLRLAPALCPPAPSA